VPGEKNPDPDGQGGIYMVDIFVRKASLLERLIPGIHDGASLVPAKAVNPGGISESERVRQSQDEMSQSQKIAAAVALRYLGKKVEVHENGVEVTTVFTDTPAEGKLHAGDVIVEANGKPAETVEDLRTTMEGVKPGETVTFGVRREGGVTDVRLETVPDPSNEDRAVVGIGIDQSATIDLPVPIKIDTGSIGGPSAGLAFALDIVDELGEDVDDAKKIVVTGALELDGRVAPIGGIKQKTIAARDADADLFLVPDENAAEARRYADGLEVIPVTTFREALSALANQ
jgi:Lon-like protease